MNVVVWQEHQDKYQVKISSFLRTHSPDPIQVGFLKTLLDLAQQAQYLDPQGSALLVENPVHSARCWHTGMTRSLLCFKDQSTLEP